MMQVAINMDKLEYNSFTKLVTKNLLILVHARKKFNVYLDLNKHDSINEALEAQLKVESFKSKELMLDEFRDISTKFVQKKRNLKSR